MEKLYKYILVGLAVLLSAGCNAEEDNTATEQATRIENYLQSNAQDQWTEVSGVYRYRIPTEDTDQGLKIEKGDAVEFYFAGYQFTTSRQEPTFYTNFGYLIEELRLAGLNTIFLPREAEKVTIGDGKLIRAIEVGLTDCFQGDSVRLFLTSKQAYGASYVSTLPLESAVEYAIVIDKVEKAKKD